LGVLGGNVFAIASRYGKYGVMEDDDDDDDFLPVSDAELAAYLASTGGADGEDEDEGEGEGETEKA
jgi:hypothetical protein